MDQGWVVWNNIVSRVTRDNDSVLIDPEMRLMGNVFADYLGSQEVSKRRVLVEGVPGFV